MPGITVGERPRQRGDCGSQEGQGDGLWPGGQKEALSHPDPYTSGQLSHWHLVLPGAPWDAPAHPHLPILQGFPDPQAEPRASLRALQGAGSAPGFAGLIPGASDSEWALAVSLSLLWARPGPAGPLSTLAGWRIELLALLLLHFWFHPWVPVFPGELGALVKI